MLIDPFTTAAQIINFLILVWLLRRFLYGPIQTAMEAREAHIKAQVAEAERLKLEAERERQSYVAQLEAFKAEEEARKQAALDDIEAWRKEQLQVARASVDALQGRWLEALQMEKDAFLRTLKERAGEQIFAVVARAFKDLSGSDLEARMLEHFLVQLRALGPGERALLLASARENGNRLVVRTAYPLADAQRDNLSGALNEALGGTYNLDFALVPDLISGIELRVNGRSLAWTLRDYLESLENSVRDAFGEEMQGEHHYASASD